MARLPSAAKKKTDASPVPAASTTTQKREFTEVTKAETEVVPEASKKAKKEEAPTAPAPVPTQDSLLVFLKNFDGPDPNSSMAAQTAYYKGLNFKSAEAIQYLSDYIQGWKIHWASSYYSFSFRVEPFVYDLNQFIEDGKFDAEDTKALRKVFGEYRDFNFWISHQCALFPDDE